MIVAGDLHDEWKILTHGALHGINHFHEKARAVLERSAVMIGTIVDRATDELCEEVAICRVQFDAIESRGGNAFSGVSEHGDNRPDLLRVHCLRAQPVEVVRRAGGAPRLAAPILDTGNILLAAGMRELQDKMAVVLVHALAHRAPKADAFVAIDHRIVWQYATGRCDRYVRRDDRGHPTRSESLFKVHARRRSRSIVVVDPT